MFELKLGFSHLPEHKRIALKLALRMMILFEWRKPENFISIVSAIKRALTEATNIIYIYTFPVDSSDNLR